MIIWHIREHSFLHVRVNNTELTLYNKLEEDLSVHALRTITQNSIWFFALLV